MTPMIWNMAEQASTLQTPPELTNANGPVNRKRSYIYLETVVEE